MMMSFFLLLTGTLFGQSNLGEVIGTVVDKKTNQPINQYHVHPNMGFDFMIDVLNTVQSISYELLYQNNCEIDYNVIIVIKIVKK